MSREFLQQLEKVRREEAEVRQAQERARYREIEEQQRVEAQRRRIEAEQLERERRPIVYEQRLPQEPIRGRQRVRKRLKGLARSRERLGREDVQRVRRPGGSPEVKYRRRRVVKKNIPPPRKPKGPQRRLPSRYLPPQRPYETGSQQTARELGELLGLDMNILVEHRRVNVEYIGVWENVGMFSIYYFHNGVDMGHTNDRMMQALRETLNGDDQDTIVIQLQWSLPEVQQDRDRKEMKGYYVINLGNLKAIMSGSEFKQLQLVEDIESGCYLNLGQRLEERKEVTGYDGKELQDARRDSTFRIYYVYTSLIDVGGGCRDYTSEVYKRDLKHLKFMVASINNGTYVRTKSEEDEDENDVEVVDIKVDNQIMKMVIFIPRTVVNTNNCGLSCLKKVSKFRHSVIEEIKEDDPQHRYATHKYAKRGEDPLKDVTPQQIRSKYRIPKGEIDFTTIEKLVKEYNLDARVVLYEDYNEDVIPQCCDIVLIDHHYVALLELPLNKDVKSKSWSRNLIPDSVAISVVEIVEHEEYVEHKPQGNVDIQPFMVSTGKMVLDSIRYDLSFVDRGLDIEWISNGNNDAIDYLDRVVDVVKDQGKVVVKTNYKKVKDKVEHVDVMDYRTVIMVTYDGYSRGYVQLLSKITDYVEIKRLIPGSILDFKYKDVDFITIDIKKFTTSKCLNDDLVAYGVNDLRGLYEKLNGFQSEFGNYFIPNYCSASSWSYDMWLRDNKYEIYNTSSYIYENYVKPGIIGGRCEATTREYNSGLAKVEELLTDNELNLTADQFNNSNITVDPLVFMDEGASTYDISSCYPSVMKDYAYPIGKPTVYEGDNILEVINQIIANNYNAIIRCKYAFYQGDEKIKYVPIPGRNSNGDLVYAQIPLSNFTVSIDQYLNLIGYGYKIFLSGVVYWKEKAPIFRTYIKKLLKLRTDNRNLNPSLANTAKIMANSIFGKTIQRPIVDRYDIINNSGKISNFIKNIAIGRNVVFDFHDSKSNIIVHYRISNERARCSKPTHLGYFILSNSKIRLHSMLEDLEEENNLGNEQPRCMYMDTDSIFIDNKYRQLLDRAGWIKNEAGYLKDENPGWRCIRAILDKKLYCQIYMNDVGRLKIHCRARGIFENTLKISDYISILHDLPVEVRQRIKRCNYKNLTVREEIRDKIVVIPKEEINIRSCVSPELIRMNTAHLDVKHLSDYVLKTHKVDIHKDIARCKTLKQCIDIVTIKLGAKKIIFNSKDYIPPKQYECDGYPVFTKDEWFEGITNWNIHKYIVHKWKLFVEEALKAYPNLAFTNGMFNALVKSLSNYSDDVKEAMLDNELREKEARRLEWIRRHNKLQYEDEVAVSDEEYKEVKDKILEILKEMDN